MALKINVSDSKTGKTYKKELSDTEAKALIGKKIGQKVKGELVQLPAGYEVQINGGSDKAGFPMRKDIEGQQRKAILISRSVGNRKGQAGMRLRKTVAGNTIAETTVQVNTHIVTYGKEPLDKPAEAEAKTKAVSEEKKKE